MCLTIAGMATYSAHDVAAEIRKRLPGVPVKKLHKLLYYCQAHHVATFDDPLFRETISAWDMGPVVGELWWREKQGDTQGTPAAQRLTEAELNTIGYVLSRYGNLTGTDLERLTHSEAPWVGADAERRQLNRTSYRITLDSMKAFFSQEAGEAEPGGSDESSVPPIDPTDLEVWLKAASDGPPAGPPVEDSPAALMARMG
jgi:uncharacterized phage-associated protein